MLNAASPSSYCIRNPPAELETLLPKTHCILPRRTTPRAAISPPLGYRSPARATRCSVCRSSADDRAGRMCDTSREHRSIITACITPAGQTNSTQQAGSGHRIRRHAASVRRLGASVLQRLLQQPPRLSPGVLDAGQIHEPAVYRCARRTTDRSGSRRLVRIPGCVPEQPATSKQPGPACPCCKPSPRAG